MLILKSKNHFKNLLQELNLCNVKSVVTVFASHSILMKYGLITPIHVI